MKNKGWDWEEDIFGFNDRGMVEYNSVTHAAICENCNQMFYGKEADRMMFGHIGCPKPNGEYIKNDVTPEKLRKSVTQALSQRDKEIMEWAEKNQFEAYCAGFRDQVISLSDLQTFIKNRKRVLWR